MNDDTVTPTIETKPDLAQLEQMGFAATGDVAKTAAVDDAVRSQIQGITDKANGLINALASAGGLQGSSAILDQLQQLKSSIPLGAADTAGLQNVVDSAVLQAQQVVNTDKAVAEQQAAALAQDVVTTAATLAAATIAATPAISLAGEKHFFKEAETFELSALDKDGNLAKTGQSLSGAQLQGDLDAVATAATTQKADAPGKEAAELAKLKDSLDHLEGYQLTQDGGDKEKAQMHHAAFENAREQIDKVVDLDHKAEQGKGSERNIANLALPEARRQMKDRLKEVVGDMNDSKEEKTVAKDRPIIRGGQEASFAQMERTPPLPANAPVRAPAAGQSMAIS